MNNILLTVTTDTPLRIDRYISANLPDISRSSAVKLIEEGNVTVNGNTVNKSFLVSSEDEIEIYPSEPEVYDVEPENIELDIIYEDDDLLVVNKPKDMVVHPAAGHYSNTLVNALLYHCKDSLSGINGVLRPGIVHRIDKNTSGLLVVAKNDKAHESLSQQIKDHTITREYRAVVYGNIKDDKGTVDLPIGRNKKDRKKMCVTQENSREAVTHYEVIERLNDFTYIKCILETGRTHQIRVHMAYIGHPVAGDDVYGPKKVITQLNGQCLHAYKLGFNHPSTGEYMEFTCDLPQVFTDFLEKLRKSVHY